MPTVWPACAWVLTCTASSPSPRPRPTLPETVTPILPSVPIVTPTAALLLLFSLRSL